MCFIFELLLDDFDDDIDEGVVEVDLVVVEFVIKIIDCFSCVILSIVGFDDFGRGCN